MFRNLGAASWIFATKEPSSQNICASIPHLVLPLTSDRVSTKRLVFPSKRRAVAEFDRKREQVPTHPPHDTTRSRAPVDGVWQDLHSFLRPCLTVTTTSTPFRFPVFSYPPDTGCELTAAQPGTPGVNFLRRRRSSKVYGFMT